MMWRRIALCASYLLLSVPVAVGDVQTDGKLVSTAATGPPLAVSSSEKVENLNADRLDGMEAFRDGRTETAIDEAKGSARRPFS